ncbi:hypothetical protein JCM10213_008417 [Rhodosporidiobolus nylandii]
MASAPRFAFSYATDSSASLPSHRLISDELTLPKRHTGLGASRDPERNPYDGSDDDIPVYGPTTHRRGRMRFVRATDGGLGSTEAEGGEVYGAIGDKGKGRAGQEEQESEDEDWEVKIVEEKPRPPSPPRPKPTGKGVRGMYESIVGVRSAPASGTASPAPEAGPAPARARLFRSPSRRAATAPLADAVKQEDADGDGTIVLSSDSDSSPPPPSRSLTRPSTFTSLRPGDELLILDPTSRLPLPPRASTSRPRPTASTTPFSRHHAPPAAAKAAPQKIHELLPPASASALQLPTHYALKPDNPGWRMLAAQGWREGSGLGPGASSSSSGGGGSGGLLVPLKATEKHDRLGLGSAGTTKAALAALAPAQRREEREKREELERLERIKRGKGARGMERVRKREERERRAMVGYLNR